LQQDNWTAYPSRAPEFIPGFSGIRVTRSSVLCVCFVDLCVSFCTFSSSDPKGHVSYCHHLASVVRRKLFQKSSPLKVLDQWKPNLVWIITRVSSFKIVYGDAVHQPTWPLLQIIEHMVKLQILGNNSKTINNIKNLTGVKWSAQQDLHTLQFWSKSDYPFWSYCPFFIKMF
jgi:hypothetical protein